MVITEYQCVINHGVCKISFQIILKLAKRLERIVNRNFDFFIYWLRRVVLPIRLDE